MMKTMLRSITLLAGVLISLPGQGFEEFVVQSIQIKGAKKVSEGAVLEDIPIQIGQRLTEEEASATIQALYKTGFFKTVHLEKEGNKLIIQLTERPTIRQLTLTGVKEKEKIRKTLREGGLAEGRFYDPATLLRIEKELERYYISRGRYAVKIESKVQEEKPGLMNVTLAIYEGDMAKIQSIKITGNTVFSEKELLKELRLSKTNWLSWFSNDNQYNKEKLEADIESLRSYYLDRGYLQFQIEAPQVTLSPDKKHIFIVIPVTEGDVYVFGDANIADQSVVPEAELKKLLRPIKPGSPFSRKTLIEVKQSIESRLGEEGYIFSEVVPKHEVDEKTRQVNLTFKVIPSQRRYVRRILIKGNSTTKDEVLRRELPQMEGTWVSSTLVNEGKEKILRRGYASTVEVETPIAAGTFDQVDVVYKIEEARLGQIGGGLGFSQTEKLMINFSLSQENFFGTGNAVDLTFDNSKASTNYSLGFQDPYFTVDGIGMGASAYYNKTNLSKTSNLSSFSTDTLGTEVRWVFPMSKYEALRFSVGYDATHLKIDPKECSEEVKDFISLRGDKFKEFVLGLGWSYDSLDQRLFPKKGVSQSFDFRTVLPGTKLQYYKMNYDLRTYHPINRSEQWIGSFSANLGYGNGYGKVHQLPFYKNYMAGGARLIRGFEENSLGPKDSYGRAFGGNALLAGSASVIFPNPISPEAKSVRTALFLDGGQVYDTRSRKKEDKNKNKRAQGIRYSLGLSLTWHTPLGGAPLSFSLAKPLNDKPGDEKRSFTFWMGSQF